MSLEQYFADDADFFLCRVYEAAWLILEKLSLWSFRVKVFLSVMVSICSVTPRLSATCFASVLMLSQALSGADL